MKKITAKQYGLEICALFGAVLLALTLIAVAFVRPPAQSRTAWIAGAVGCLFVLSSHSGFKSTWHSFKKKLRSFTPMLLQGRYALKVTECW